MVSTIEKGDELEDRFHQYLLDQQNSGELVYGAYPPELCKIYRKRRYYCKEREGYVTFDVVVELYRQGGTSPHLCVVFECKNYKGAIPENEITDFSDKVGRIFKHAAKGVVVVSTRLQSGAERIAQKRKIGIVKYNEQGVEIVAERKGGIHIERRYVETQIFRKKNSVKPLKFSAFYDGNYYASVGKFLSNLDPSQIIDRKDAGKKNEISIPYITDDAIKDSTQKILGEITYESGPVELNKVCAILNLNLRISDAVEYDEKGEYILGSANFDRKSIQVYSHNDSNRERFTIAHEVGHFCLNHDQYLRSEFIVERDLTVCDETEESFNYERLEHQANLFASYLVLPEEAFLRKTAEFRMLFGIEDRGHGYIYVDNQPCNYESYNLLLQGLSSYFEVSKQAIEIRFKKNGMLSDQRRLKTNRPRH
ncbi:MAG: ImmA/IrrE family metallo-endopeptidase [Alphaproteobacteria bacterium]